MLKQEADDWRVSERDPRSLRMRRLAADKCLHHIMDSYTYLMTFLLHYTALYLVPVTDLTKTYKSDFPYTDSTRVGETRTDGTEIPCLL